MEFLTVQIDDSKNGNCFLILQSLSAVFISLAGTVIYIFTKPGDGNRNFFHWAIVSKAMTLSFIIHPDSAGPEPNSMFTDQAHMTVEFNPISL